MKLKNLLCLFIILKGLAAYPCQRDTIKLFYDINQKKLSPVNKTRLDSVNNFLSDTSAVNILGFADYLGKKQYNYFLSKSRAEIVKNYLLNLHSKNVLIIADGKGEVSPATKNLSVLGEPVNRRVDIIIPSKAAKIQIANKPVKDSTTHKADTGTVYDRINNLSNMDVGQSVSFKELTFQPGRHYLREGAVPYLEALTAYLKEHENLKIEIQGHVCCETNHEDGFDADLMQKNLSVTRAKYIYEYLMSHGIDAERMQYKGMGSDHKKIFPERTVDDQNQNRRVEIVLLSK